MASSVSDPQLNNSTLVQPTSSLLHPIHNNDSQPSDPPNHHLSSDQKVTNTLHPHKFQINQKEEASREQQEQNGSNNNTRKEYNFLAVAPVGETGVPPPLGSHQVDGWFDGDEKVPLKKRKGQETMLMLEDEEKKMKSKTNKKCTSTSGMQQSHSEQDKAGNDDSSSTPNNSTTVKKMNKRGSVIMEGSRCSRVNGRGWRCCQQTLVGYSLCEHHLGKGRLRSISNVKARTKAPNTVVVATTIAPQNDTPQSTTNDSTGNDNQSSKNVLVSSPVVQPPVGDLKDTVLLDGSCYDDDEDEDANEDEDDDDYNEEETKKPLVVKKKRMKLGMVKARSLSSLLNQTN